jgi:HKD family nuclease
MMANGGLGFMVELAWNTNNQTVASVLGKYALDADRILIAVAFFSKSGWTIVRDWLQDSLDRGCQVEFFVGTDFYQTDPSALRAAAELLRGRDGCTLWMCKPNSKSVFHPKLYVFEGVDESTVVVGSANLTSGGLRNNREVCCSFSVSPGSAAAGQLETIFASYRSDEDVRQATVLDIARYEGEWSRFQRRVRKAKREANKEIKALPVICEDKLRQYLSEYRDNDDEQKDYESRARRYERIPALLDRLAAVKTRPDFLEIYEQLVGKQGQRGLWHSGRLFRKKNQVADGYPEACAMIRTIHEHSDASATELFEFGIPFVRRVTGMGVNVLTEVMNSYYPDRCPVLNISSLGSVQHLAIGRFPEPQSFDAEDYDRFTEILDCLRDLCDFGSMGRVDHFLNYVYRKYVEPNLESRRR